MWEERLCIYGTLGVLNNFPIAFAKSLSMIKLETRNPKETKFDFQIASKILSYSLSTINIWNLLYFKIF